MSSESKAVISFPIRFEVDPQNVEEVKRAQEEIAASGGDGREEAEVLLEEEVTDKKAIEALTEFIETTDREGLRTLSAFAKNPQGLVENEFMSILGKAGVHGALAAAIISLIISTPEIIRTIVKALSVKGGWLNQDFHREFANEVQLGISRDLQYRRAAGLDVIITNHDRGFLLQDPEFVDNNLVDVDTTRSIRTNSNNTQYGYMAGM